MKVLHVIDSLGVGGGAEHSLVKTLPLLRERGIDNHVVCLTPREGGLQEVVRSSGFPLTVLRPGGRLAQLREMRQLVRQTAPDVAHATLLRSSILTRVACVGLPCVQLNSLVNTTYDPVRLKSLGIAPWKSRVLLFVDRVTTRLMTGGFHAISSPVKEEAVELLGADPDNVWLVPRGRSSSSLGEWSMERRDATRDVLGLGPEDLVVLNVGRQDMQKAHDLLVDAFAGVVDRVPSAKLLIAGRPGSGTAALDDALDRSPARSAITLFGHRTDIGDLLCAADVFAFPSHYEGLGGSLIEAMALRCPIVASDAPAIAEVLGSGTYGRLVPRGDARALADALVGLLSSPEERARLAAMGRERFETTYELERVADLTVEMYSQVLERHAHRQT